MRTLVRIFLITAMLTSLISAQEYVCGDSNYDSATNVGDAVFTMDYLFGGGPATELPDADYANFDGAEFLTIQDVIETIDFAFHGPGPICPIGPPVVPVVDSNFVLLYTAYVPVGVTSPKIALTLYMNNWYTGFELPLRIRVDGEIPTIDSVDFFPRHAPVPTRFASYTIYPDSGEIAIGFARLIEIVDSIDQIGTIYLTVPASGVARPISVEWTRLTPIQALPADSASIYPMVCVTRLSYQREAYEPILTPTCCINAGDANNDGYVNVGDVISIINWVFSEPAPLCISSTDANADGYYNIGDAVFLINYIFRDGPAPLCGDNN